MKLFLINKRQKRYRRKQFLIGIKPQNKDKIWQERVLTINENSEPVAAFAIFNEHNLSFREEDYISSDLCAMRVHEISPTISPTSTNKFVTRQGFYFITLILKID